MEYYTRTIESCNPNELFTNEIIAICKEQVQQMPDITKQVFTLKTEGRSYKEIADILNISTKKVDKELQNATVKLRLSLKDYLSVLVIFLLFSKNKFLDLSNIKRFIFLILDILHY